MKNGTNSIILLQKALTRFDSLEVDGRHDSIFLANQIRAHLQAARTDEEDTIMQDMETLANFVKNCHTMDTLTLAMERRKMLDIIHRYLPDV